MPITPPETVTPCDYTWGKKEKGMEKQQLTRPEPATSRSVADPLAAEPRSPPASIDPFPSQEFSLPCDYDHKRVIISCADFLP